MRDFTLKLYENLLTTLKLKGFIVQPIDNYQNEQQNTIILRHDIDAKPYKALSMALIEHKCDISSSFFFKIQPDILIPEIVQQIATLDHKIGYHYEDLVRNHGNYSKAISDFERNLDLMRKVVPVTSICADGNPLSKYNNLWLWEKYDYRKFGIECEIYLDVDYNKIAYYTDTSRCWDGNKYNVWDHVNSERAWPQYHSTFDIMHAINKGSFPVVSEINIHPQRWSDSYSEWLIELCTQNIKNIAKYIMVKRRENNRTHA